MNFLDSFLMLCERKDVPPSRALEDAGLSKSLYSKWKQKPESIPNGATLEKLAVFSTVSDSVSKFVSKSVSLVFWLMRV